MGDGRSRDLQTGTQLPTMRKRYSPFVLLFLIFIIFSFFRFYNLDKRVIFDWDQERDAFVIKQLLLERKLTLIGPRVLGPEGFFLGPYFIYLLAPFYFLTRLHPEAIIFFIIAYNFVFFILSFLVLKKLFGYPTALIFLLIWSLHPALIGIDTIVWNPLLVPLVVIISWALLFIAFKKQSFGNWLWVGILVGLGTNFHFQLIYLLPFNLVFLFSQKKKLLKKTVAFFGGFALPFLPLLFFDLRHNFLNLKLLLDFLREKGTINYLAWLPVWENVAGGFIGKKLPLLSLVFYFLPLLIMFYLLQREKEKFKRRFFLATIILWLVFPLGFAFFGQRPSEYYFNFLYPFLVLLLTQFLLKIARNWQLVFLFVLLFFFLNINRLKIRIEPRPQGLFYKEKVVQRIAEIGQGKKFNVSFSVPLGMDTGYRYLLEFYQAEQSQNPDDPLLRIVIPPEKEPVSETFGKIGLFIPENFEN